MNRNTVLERGTELKIECITSWKWRLHTREDLFKNIEDSLDPIPKCDTLKFKINRLSVRD